MLIRFFLCVCFFTTVSFTPVTAPLSKGKQQKFFPKELKKKDIYLGMSLEKFCKKVPTAKQSKTSSEFKIEFIETSTVIGITSYRYLLTQSSAPALYAIEIMYDDMESVQRRAIDLLGAPTSTGEWRIPADQIKEDFTMGAWTFGHKLVYGATLRYSEWEKGFQSQ